MYQSHWAILWCPILTTSYSRMLPVRFPKRCWCVSQGWMWLMNRCVSNYAAILLRYQNPVTSCAVCWRSLLRIFDKSGVCLLRVTLQYPLFIPTSRVGPETILSRKFILLYPLRKLLGKIPFLSKKGLPSPVLPWRYKKAPGISTQFGNICNW